MNESDKHPPIPPRRFIRRLVLLGITIGSGIVIALTGYYFTANQKWFLAIPGVLALVWLFLANPRACCHGESRSGRDNSPKG